jgi:tRNA pseudouridine38-40 synthase
MHRLALGLEYVGTNYSGWQSQINQPGVPSVQAALEQALSYVAAHPITVRCAGRTDAGVHASGQVVHCDVEVMRSERAWVFGCNSKLPRDIRVLWAKQVPADFDARRSATSRQYQYIVYNNPIRPVLLHEYVSWHYRSLDASLMHTAAQALVGEHDFSSFRAAGCQSVSPIREIRALRVKRSGNFVIIEVEANAFLYHMVRNLAGTLLDIGDGTKSISWSTEVLNAKDRTKASVTAPPQGLYLAGVRYPASLEVPESDSGLWFINQG